MIPSDAASPTPRKWLTALRRAKGLTQQAIAEMLGVRRTAVTQWERGRSGPTRANVYSLAILLGPVVHEWFAQEEEEEVTHRPRSEWLPGGVATARPPAPALNADAHSVLQALATRPNWTESEFEAAQLLLAADWGERPDG